MDLFFYTFLFIFGTMFGSFASVLIYRIKSWEGGICTGRSHCKTCVRDLSALELVPIFSWLFQRGKCKGCKSKISSIYPLLEMSTWILFVLTWVFLVDSSAIFIWNMFEWGKMFFFLSIIFLTIIYVFYDILYLEIPESILLSANILAFFVLIIQGLWLSIIPYMNIWGWDIITICICLSILWALYYVMLAGLKEVYDCLIVFICIALISGYLYFTDVTYYSSALISWTIAALWVFISFFLQIVVSKGRAMWGGDLRIAILMGLLVGVGYVFPAWMLCYIVWSIIGVGIIIVYRLSLSQNKDDSVGFKHQIPFGPFIASGYLCVLFFHTYISSFIEWYF